MMRIWFTSIRNILSEPVIFATSINCQKSCLICGARKEKLCRKFLIAKIAFFPLG